MEGRGFQSILHFRLYLGLTPKSFFERGSMSNQKEDLYLPDDTQGNACTHLNIGRKFLLIHLFRDGSAETFPLIIIGLPQIIDGGSS